MSKGGYQGGPKPTGNPPKPLAFRRYGCPDCGRQFWPKPTQAVKARDDVKPARDEDALHLLRTDPAEYFRRRDEKAGWPPRASERVLIGGEPEDMYRDGDEIIVSGTFHIYVDEAVPLAIALLKVATGE